MYNNERNAITYDPKDHVVHFDGSRWYHKNAEWTGDRIVIVLYTMTSAATIAGKASMDPIHKQRKRGRSPCSQSPSPFLSTPKAVSASSCGVL